MATHSAKAATKNKIGNSSSGKTDDSDADIIETTIHWDVDPQTGLTLRHLGLRNDKDLER